MKYYKEAEILFNPHFCETSVLFSLIQIIKKQSVDRTKLSLLTTTRERETTTSAEFWHCLMGRKEEKEFIEKWKFDLGQVFQNGALIKVGKRSYFSLAKPIRQTL